MANLAETINLMAEDKSNDWSAEIEALVKVEKELAKARDDLETYRTNVGSIEGLVATSRFARLGRHTAALLGSHELVAGADMLTSIAKAWNPTDDNAISDQTPEQLAYWRKFADSLGIKHDGANAHLAKE